MLTERRAIGSLAMPSLVTRALDVDRNYKDAVRFVATSGTFATDFDNGSTVDGVTVATGDRFLYQPQTGRVSTSGPTVGVYIAAASGAPTRAPDFDTGSDFPRATILVTDGTIGAGSQWTCINALPPTLGVTDITFREYRSGTSSYRGRTIDAVLGDTRDLRNYDADYGGAADWDYDTETGTDNTAALNQAILESADGDVIKLGPGFRKFSSTIVIDKVVHLVGEGPEGTHLIFADCDGLDYQLSGQEREFGVRVRGLTFVTTVNGTRKAFNALGPIGTSGGNSNRLIMEDVEFYGVDRVTVTGDGNTSAFTWKTCVHLSSMSRAHVINSWAFGNSSDITAGWPNDTTMIKIDGGGVAGEGCTGVVLWNPRCQFFKYGVEYSGQSEGIYIGGDFQFVAVKEGVYSHGLEAPANQMIVRDGHISATHKGIHLEPVGGGSAPIFGFDCQAVTFLPREEANVVGYRSIYGYFRLSNIMARFLGTNVDPRTMQHAAIEIMNDNGYNNIHDCEGSNVGIAYLASNPGSGYNKINNFTLNEDSENSVISVTDWDVTKRDIYEGNTATGVIGTVIQTGTATAGAAASITLDHLASHNLKYDAQTGDFTTGQIVTGPTGSGTIFAQSDRTLTTGTLFLESVTGTFADGDAITDPLGGAATANGAARTITDSLRGMWATLTGGTGAGQIRMATASNGATKVVTVHANWGTNPDATTTFSFAHKTLAGRAVYGATQHEFWLPDGPVLSLPNTSGPLDIHLEVVAGTLASGEMQLRPRDANNTNRALRVMKSLKVGSPTGGEPVAGVVNIATEYEVNAVKVVGARSTGWTAMTGTGLKTALAAAAAGTASAGYVQAELQAALNRIAAMEARMKAYDDALVAHGLIGT